MPATASGLNVPVMVILRASSSPRPASWSSKPASASNGRRRGGAAASVSARLAERFLGAGDFGCDSLVGCLLGFAPLPTDLGNGGCSISSGVQAKSQSPAARDVHE